MSSKPGSYSVGGCSTNLKGNTLNTVKIGKGTGDSGNIDIQRSMNETLESIIKNKIDPDYKLCEPSTTGGSPEVPPVPGTGYVYFNFDPQVPPNPSNQFIPVPAGYDTEILNNGAQFRLLFSEQDGKFYYRDTAVDSDYTRDQMIAGVNVRSVNISLNPTTNILKILGYWMDVGSIIDNSSPVFSYTINLNDAILKKFPVTQADYEDNFNLDYIYYYKTSAPAGVTTDSVPITNENFFGSTEKSHVFILESQHGNQTLYGKRININSTISNPSSYLIEAYVMPGIPYQKLIPAVPPTGTAFMYHEPSGAGQNPPASKDYLYNYLIKSTGYTSGACSPITDPVIQKQIKSLVNAIYDTGKRAAKLVQETEETENDNCSENASGRNNSCIPLCGGSFNVSVQ